MDKPEILERIRKVIGELNSGSPLFATTALLRIENDLGQDVAAEMLGVEAVVKDGETDWTSWSACERLRKKCLQLRAERDAAREQHDLAAQQRDQLQRDLAELKKNVRPPSDYSDLVAENARLRVAVHTEQRVVLAVTAALDREREAHLQLQADRRDPNVELLAAQFDAHREDIHDALARHDYRLASLENRLAALKDI